MTVKSKIDEWKMIMAQNGKTRKKISIAQSESFEMMMGTSPSCRPISHSKVSPKWIQLITLVHIHEINLSSLLVDDEYKRAFSCTSSAPSK